MVLARALALLLFILPAYFSNGSPVLFGGGRDVIDGGAKLWDKRRLFGDGKTWRGLFAGLALGSLSAGLLALLVPAEFSLGLSQSQRALAGVLLTVGAQAGDLLGSFIKRRLGLKRGERALFLDQLLFLFMGLLLASSLYLPPLPELLFLTVATLVLHPAANVLAFWLKLKGVPW